MTKLADCQKLEMDKREIKKLTKMLLKSSYIQLVLLETIFTSTVGKTDNVV